jgi:XTP/dITP diphosphohydrolase
VHASSNLLRLLVASSNPGKLREYQALGGPAGASPAGAMIDLAFIPNFDSLPLFEEIWPTFAENAAGKALHYSRLAKGIVIADDSGLVVPALGGAPGVLSARYAGPGASDMDRIHKLLSELRVKKADDRQAKFVCVVAVAEAGNMRGLFSAAAEGIILEEPRGKDGFGYDPVFFFPALGKTYAEISREEKNLYSHRGKAFHKALNFLLKVKE